MLIAVIDLELPYKVQLTEVDSRWQWATEERGGCDFDTAEQALEASQKVRASLKGW